MGINSSKDLLIGLCCFVLGILYQLVSNWNLICSPYLVDAKECSILMLAVGVPGDHWYTYQNRYLKLRFAISEPNPVVVPSYYGVRMLGIIPNLVYRKSVCLPYCLLV